MKKYYLLAYRSQYQEIEQVIFNTVIDKNPFDYLIEQALEGEYLYFVSAYRITKKQYKRFMKLSEEEFPDWWIE